MVTDDEFASYVKEWDAFLEDHETIDLILHVEPSFPLRRDQTLPYVPPLSSNRYFVTYEGREMDLSYKQANQVHYWFVIQREKRARKHPVPPYV